MTCNSWAVCQRLFDWFIHELEWSTAQHGTYKQWHVARDESKWHASQAMNGGLRLSLSWIPKNYKHKLAANIWLLSHFTTANQGGTLCEMKLQKLLETRWSCIESVLWLNMNEELFASWLPCTSTQSKALRYHLPPFFRSKKPKRARTTHKNTTETNSNREAHKA